jgi:hypothetical protein
MLRYVLTLLMALAVAGAPMAAELCQIVCAMDDGVDGGTAAAAHEHSCHAEAAEDGQVQLSAPAHACDYDEDVPSAPGTAGQYAANSALATSVASDFTMISPPHSAMCRASHAVQTIASERPCPIPLRI